MKKCLIVALLLSILLAGCTAQQKMNAEIFVGRLCKTAEYSCDELGGIAQKGDKAYAFVTSPSGARLSFGFDFDENFIVTKVGFNTERRNAEDFLAAVSDCCNVFAPDDADSFELMKENLRLTKGLPEPAAKYYSSSWYRYSLVVTDTTAYFAVESKRSVPDAATEYTLRVNETYSTQ